MSTTFTARLNRLFDTVYPPGRGPHTSAEVIAALRSEGITMSAPYLSQLRSGNRTNPSSATMKALANFFRIKPAYFTDDEYYEKLDQELTWLANMRDEGVRRNRGPHRRSVRRGAGSYYPNRRRIPSQRGSRQLVHRLSGRSTRGRTGQLGVHRSSSRRGTHSGTGLYNSRTMFGTHQPAVLGSDRENPFAIGVSVRLV